MAIAAAIVRMVCVGAAVAITTWAGAARASEALDRAPAGAIERAGDAHASQASSARAPQPSTDERLFDAFTQSSPTPGAAPSRRTELRLWQSERSLHVAIRAWDPQPQSIVARQMRRDVEAMLSEDQVSLVIDADGAGRNGLMFAVNPNGAQYDALVYDGGQVREDWDAVWHSEAFVDEHGWQARLTIPLSVFGQGDAKRWRINAERWMPRGSERVRLAGAQPDKYVYTLGEALPMPAFRSGDDGWNLRIKPSLRITSESSAASGTGHAEHRLAPGLELFHESRSGLRSALALNIDFGEAEADERLLNLTRFELIRTEKREFFLRDAGRFTFGGLDGSAVMPFYSRRVGLDASGRARSLDAGLKLTGTAAGLDFGAFAARVAGGPVGQGLDEQSSSDVAVARLSRAIDTRQRLGLIVTRGNQQGTPGSRLAGIDYQFRDTGWRAGKTLQVDGWAMQSSRLATSSDDGATSAGASVRGHAWGGSVRYLNVGPMFDADFQRIDAGFDAALGYLAETNVMRSVGTAGWWHRTAAGSDIIPALDWRWRRTLDGREYSLTLNPEIAYTTAAGDTVMAEFVHEADRLANGYSPVPGATIAAGEYRWNYLYGYLETSPSRPVWAIAELRHGGYYDGRRNDQWLTVGIKPDPRWGVRIGYGRNAIALPSGRFTVHLATLRFDYTPTTRMTQSVLVQWDNLTRELGLSARLRWWWAPGRELLFALDRLGYTGERSAQLPGQTRATLKWVWHLER